MKKTAIILGAAVAFSAAFACLPACDAEPVVEYSLAENGGSYIVSKVSGGKGSLKEYDIPASYEGLPVTEIGDEAFMNCTRLYRLSVPDTVTRIGVRAFMQCAFRQFEIPDSVTEIGFGAFGKCDSLEAIVIPESVTKIEEKAVAFCTALKKATVKAPLEELPAYLFYNSTPEYNGTIYSNSSLETVYLPATLKKIQLNSLSGNRIKDIYFAGTEEQWDELYFYELESDGKDGKKEKKLEKADVLADVVKVHCNYSFSDGT